jgi:molybdopterin synthase sulfur carrier subunit
MIRVTIPFHLQSLSKAPPELHLDVPPPITQRSVLDALESSYPMLKGTIRDHGTLKRRPFLRFYACNQDLSNADPDSPLPEAIAQGREPFLIIGAIAGG